MRHAEHGADKRTTIWIPKRRANAYLPQRSRSLPGTPTAIPITPLVWSIVVGVVLSALGVWTLTVWMPAQRSSLVETANHAVVQGVRSADDANRLVENALVAGNGCALLLAIAGLSLFINGIVHRSHAEVECRVCNRRVVARKVGGCYLECPLGDHVARFRGGPLAAVAVFILALFLLGSAGGTSPGAPPRPGAHHGSVRESMTAANMRACSSGRTRAWDSVTAPAPSPRSASRRT